jgi:hypothetical protein
VKRKGDRIAVKRKGDRIAVKRKGDRIAVKRERARAFPLPLRERARVRGIETVDNVLGNHN